MLTSTRTLQERRLERRLDELRDRLSRQVSPFEDATKEAATARYEACEHDTEAFGHAYAPHYFESESAAFHSDLDAMADAGVRHIFVVHGPREHAKSTRLRIALLRKICYGQVRYPLVGSEDLKLSRAHLEAFKLELEENRRIQADFRVEILTWDKSDGILRLRVSPVATESRHMVQIEAISYRTKVKGKLFLQHRPDFALLDDFEDTNSARNERIASEKVEWALKDLYPAVSARAPIVWLGNTGADTSALYQAMLRCYGGDEDELRAFLQQGSEAGGAGRVIEASRRAATLLAEEEPAPALSAHCYRAERTVDDRTAYLWPARYVPSWYALMRATMGPALYDSEMNGYPVREGKFFKAEWFLEYDALPESGEVYWFTWCDPAFGKSKDACYKCIAVVATDGLVYYVVDAWVRQQDPVAAMIEQWYSFFETYDLLRSGKYENNFGQDDRLERDFDDAAERHGWPLPVAGDANAVNKNVRIESLQPLASQGRIRWPKKPNNDVKRLKNQVLSYPDGALDGPDCLESCIARMRTRYTGKMEYESLGKRRYRKSTRVHGRHR